MKLSWQLNAMKASWAAVVSVRDEYQLFAECLFLYQGLTSWVAQVFVVCFCMYVYILGGYMVVLPGHGIFAMGPGLPYCSDAKQDTGSQSSSHSGHTKH
jgi:hypothetical protein